MKRLQLLLFFLLIACSVSAQRRIVEYDKQGNKVKIIRELPIRVDKHELRLSVGTPTPLSNQLMGNYLYYHDIEYQQSKFREDINNSNTYLTDRYFWGNYALSYVYHSRRWLQFGGTMTVGVTSQSRRHNSDNSKVESLSGYAIGVMPTVRFVWLYREKVQLYSSLSVGVVFGTEEVVPLGDMTVVGCSFGRKVFGFVELGGGMAGVARVGLGYRFDASKKVR